MHAAWTACSKNFAWWNMHSMDEIVFFTADHAPPHTDYYPLCVALAQAWPIDKLVTREKKIVIATSLLWCTTAQSSCCHPCTTGDGHASRDRLTSSAKNWCWQKKRWILRLRKFARPLRCCGPKVHAPYSTHSKPQWNMQQINDAKN